jgi:hypothetical protein
MTTLCATFTTFDEAYWHIYNTIDRHGIESWPRDQKCFELRPAYFKLLDPRRSIYNGVIRSLNLRFFAIEALGYIAGIGGPGDEWYADLLCASNRQIEKFRNPKTHLLDGAYGPRLAKSLPGTIELLKRDCSTRQAVMAIWSPGVADSLYDVPCTVSLQLFNSAPSGLPPKLDMITYMRSNDVNWGLPYDVPAFCSIQCMIADLLGWNLGTYHHFDGSLHLYDKMRPAIVDGEVMHRPSHEIPSLRAHKTIEEVMSIAEGILREVYEQIIDKNVKWRDIDIPGLDKWSEWWLDHIRNGKVK